MLGVALIWGATFAVVKNALDHTGPLSFVFIRFFMASSLLVVLFRKKLFGLPYQVYLAGIFLGLFTGGGFLFQTLGLQTVPSGKAAFVTGLYMALVPLYGWIAFRWKIGRNQISGLALMLVGLGFLCLNEQFQVETGDLWNLGCAIVFSAQVVGVTYFTERWDHVEALTVIQIVTVFFMSMIAAFIWEKPTLDLNQEVWIALFITSVFATALALYLQMRYQKQTSATTAGLLMAMEVPFGGFFGWLLLNEILTTKEWIGCGFMLVGIVLVELQPREASPLQGATRKSKSIPGAATNVQNRK